MNYLQQLLATLLCLFAAVVQAQPLQTAFGSERAPFLFQSQGQWQGIELDIVKAVLDGAGHSIGSSIHVSNKRLSLAVPKMNYDMAVSVNGDDSQGVYYSNRIIEFKNFAVSKKSSNVVVNSIEDLVNYDVVAWQNAVEHLGPKFNQLFSAKNQQNRAGDYQEYIDQRKQNQLFWLGRTEVILVDRSIFFWNKKILSDQYDVNVELTYHDIFPTTSHYKVAFKDAGIRDAFNQGLKSLRESGGYQEILERYIK